MGQLNNDSESREGNQRKNAPSDVDLRNAMEAYHAVMRRSEGAEEAMRSQEGGELIVREFAARLGVSESTVRRYRRERKIVALQSKGGCWVYPAWQIYDGRLLPALVCVIEILREKDYCCLSIVAFILSRRDVLDGKRPLDLLRLGNINDVLLAANQAGDMGA